MASFAKASTQANRAIRRSLALGKASHNSKESGKIHSVATAKAYEDSLKLTAQWDKENGGKGLTLLDTSRAVAYLIERAEYVTQKTLDKDRQALQILPNVDKPERIKSHVINTGLSTQSRAYRLEQVDHIVSHQKEHNAIATEISREAGLRAHELYTIRPLAEQAISTHRKFSDERFEGRLSFVSYSVVGKGGLIREVRLSPELSQRLENKRFEEPKDAIDRGIHYQQHYDIGAGKSWSQSFSSASKREFGWSNGAHGLRHSYAQDRMKEIQGLGHTYQSALEIVSQEMGHFRADITEVYLR
ncbi:hypothetical protein [uncultured Cocleimonas sp.]|uniref:hypothetical protein n=1 Tax=uncultured Cocleimonas sp. TaxID=1051587 RepID=UPI002621B93F|nr:hypothetical protein [uncultured Cocleimonas sp.]